MESRLSGRDIGFDAPSDEDDDHAPPSPANYLVANDEDSSQAYERNDNEDNQLQLLREAPGQPGWSLARHHPPPLAGFGIEGDAAGTGRRVRRIGRTHPPDRGECAEEDEGTVRRLIYFGSRDQEAAFGGFCFSGLWRRLLVRRGGVRFAEDDARRALVAPVRHCPIHQHDDTVAEADQEPHVRPARTTMPTPRRTSAGRGGRWRPCGRWWPGCPGRDRQSAGAGFRAGAHATPWR